MATRPSHLPSATIVMVTSGLFHWSAEVKGTGARSCPDSTTGWGCGGGSQCTPAVLRTAERFNRVGTHRSHPDFYNPDHISPLRMHYISLITQNKPPSPQYCPQSLTPFNPTTSGLTSPSVIASCCSATIRSSSTSGPLQWLFPVPGIPFLQIPKTAHSLTPFQAPVQILPFPMDNPPQITLFKISTIQSSLTLPIIPQHSSPPQK